MISTDSGWPGIVTRPVTGPFAHPAATSAASAIPTIRPAILSMMRDPPPALAALP
jgi:hypothetical protein